MQGAVANIAKTTIGKRCGKRMRVTLLSNLNCQVGIGPPGISSIVFHPHPGIDSKVALYIPITPIAEDKVVLVIAVCQ